MAELTLAELTIRTEKMVKRDVGAVEKSLVTSFKSVDRVRFEQEGEVQDAKEARGGEQRTWHRHAHDIFERYCNGQWSECVFGKKQLKGTSEDLEEAMQENWEFFYAE